MLKTSRQTPATNRVHTQLRRRLKRHRPRPRPTITSPSSSPISTSSRSPPLAAPADAACDSADRRPRRPRSSTTRRPCGAGDAALAMADVAVAVACLHQEAADALLGARLRRAEADATSSCGATRAPSKTPPRRVSAAPPRRRRAGASPSSRRRPSAARKSPSACAPPPRSWTRNIPLLARHPRRSSSLSTSQGVLARTVVLLRGPAGQQ